MLPTRDPLCRPRMTIPSTSSGNGHCKAFASSPFDLKRTTADEIANVITDITNMSAHKANAVARA